MDLAVKILVAAGSEASLGFGNRSNSYSITTVLGATCILWFLRTAQQLVSPQGSISRLLQYGMLSAFVFVFGCYAAALGLILFGPGTL